MFVLVIQITVSVAVILDIPVARQVIAFFYLTFMPGLAIVRLLKLDKPSMSQSVFFAVILSIAFLMITGVFINELYNFGVSMPLDPLIIVLSINLSVLVLAVLDSLINRKGLYIGQRLKIRLGVLGLTALPILSVAGASLTNASQGNAVSLFSIAVISTMVVFVALYDKMPELRPMILLLTLMSILLSSWLLTNYVSGWDEWTEFYVFRLTQSNLHWNLHQSASWDPELMKTNAMASVSILPTIYSEVLGLGSSLVFKIVFPIILSFMALGLYELYKTQTNKKIAFLASFFYLAATVGFTGPMKQMIAQLFFISLFILLLNKHIRSSPKKVLFVILDFALVISHYSLALLFLLAMFFVWLLDLLWSRFRNRARPAKISTTILLVSFAMTFSWYIYVSSSGAFYGLLDPIRRIIENFSTDLFDLSARGNVVLQGIGVIQAPSILNRIGSYVFYLTEFLILVGFITVVVKRKQVRLDTDYIAIATFFMAILISNLLIPNLAVAFRMERFYQVSLILLAPLCIFGIEALAKKVSRFKSETAVLFLALIILVPFFLFRSGFVYEVAKVQSESLPLSMYRIDPLTVYGLTTNDQDVFGTLWLSQYANTANGSIYSDNILINHVLYAYGMISKKNRIILSNTTKITDNNGPAYVFLGQFNLNDGLIVDDQGNVWNTSRIAGVLIGQNEIYSNAGCEVYSLTP